MKAFFRADPFVILVFSFIPRNKVLLLSQRIFQL